jgi:hypothetical protein
VLSCMETFLKTKICECKLRAQSEGVIFRFFGKWHFFGEIRQFIFCYVARIWAPDNSYKWLAQTNNYLLPALANYIFCISPAKCIPNICSEPVRDFNKIGTVRFVSKQNNLFRAAPHRLSLFSKRPKKDYFAYLVQIEFRFLWNWRRYINKSIKKDIVSIPASHQFRIFRSSPWVTSPTDRFKICFVFCRFGGRPSNSQENVSKK